MRPTTALLATVLAVATVSAASGGAWALVADQQPAAGQPTAEQRDAGGNANQAVATTAANAARPAHGANSFTRTQAVRRINRRGFHQVHDLIKDDNGVWHGAATRDGASVQVWEDYKGNVGTE